MNIFQRAFISIKRSPARSAILFVLVLLLGTVTAAALSITNAVSVTENSIYNKSSTVATVDSDYDRARDEVNAKIITAEVANEIMFSPDYWPTAAQLDSIGELPQVDFYDYWWYSTVDGLFSSETGEDLRKCPTDGEENSYQRFSIKGTRLAEPLDFRTGMLKLIDGRLFGDTELEGKRYGVVISKRLADHNGLRVGSKVTFENILYETSYFGESDHILTRFQFEAEIVGLFDIESEMSEYAENNEIYDQIFGTLAFQKRMRAEYKEQMRLYQPDIYESALDSWDDVKYENYFVLTSPKVVDDFRTAAAEYLPDYTTVTATTDFTEPLTAPLSTMKSLARAVLIASVIGVVVILCLVIMLFLRARRGEMGIYLALGERRVRIIGQIIVEVLVVAVLAITLSLFIGNAVSGQVSEKLILRQVTDAAQRIEQGEYELTGDNLNSNLTKMGYSKLINDDFIVENYDVRINGQMVLIFYGVGIASIILASAVSMLYVVALDPKKVLLMEG